MRNSDNLEELLSIDPIQVAEDLSGGNPYPALSLGAAIYFNELKRSALQKANDSYYNIPYAEFVSLVTENGFEEVYGWNFSSIPYGNEAPVQESYKIFWNAEHSVMVTAESYNGTQLNSAKMHLFATSKDTSNLFGLGGSSSPCDFVPEGYEHTRSLSFDVREGFRLKLNKILNMEGVMLLKEWPEQMFLWLLDYTQPKQEEYDYKALTAAVVARLPEHVRKAIGPFYK